MKGGEGGQGRKPNKLSGCNNVRSPDKLLANTATLSLPAHNPCPLLWQPFLPATGLPGSGAPSPWDQSACQIEDMESRMM